MDIYKYVNRSTTKLTHTMQLAICTRNDYTDKAAIMSFGSEDFIYVPGDASTAHDVWKVVEDHWD